MADSSGDDRTRAQRAAVLREMRDRRESEQNLVEIVGDEQRRRRAADDADADEQSEPPPAHLLRRDRT